VRMEMKSMSAPKSTTHSRIWDRYMRMPAGSAAAAEEEPEPPAPLEEPAPLDPAASAVERGGRRSHQAQCRCCLVWRLSSTPFASTSRPPHGQTSAQVSMSHLRRGPGRR
jgi:hypothetical protein